MKVYISHSIRGKMGKDATTEYMQENNQKAIEFCNQLKEEFPTIDFYCPGEHDEFVLIGYKEGILTEEQILQIDCQIVAKCSLLINYSPNGYLSKGMVRENNEALWRGISIITMKDVTEVDKIHRFLENKMKG
jgi:hypothetical protein